MTFPEPESKKRFHASGIHTIDSRIKLPLGKIFYPFLDKAKRIGSERDRTRGPNVLNLPDRMKSLITGVGKFCIVSLFETDYSIVAKAVAMVINKKVKNVINKKVFSKQKQISQ